MHVSVPRVKLITEVVLVQFTLQVAHVVREQKASASI